jgi:hypothetical protein
MSPPRVLLLGGHGKVALLMTPHLLSRSWHVTSVVRNPDHEDEIKKLGQDQPGKLDVLVESIENVKSDEQAQKILDKVKPNYVVWSAGTGHAFPLETLRCFQVSALYKRK